MYGPAAFCTAPQELWMPRLRMNSPQTFDSDAARCLMASDHRVDLAGHHASQRWSRSAAARVAEATRAENELSKPRPIVSISDHFIVRLAGHDCFHR